MAYRSCPQKPRLNSQNPVINASQNALRLMKQTLEGRYDCLIPQETIKPDGTINRKGVSVKDKGLVQPRNKLFFKRTMVLVKNISLMKKICTAT